MTTKEPGNDSVHDFIVSLEAKAKRILKEADKKRREDLRLEHVKQFASGLKSKTKNENKMAQNGSVLIPLLDTSTIHSTTKILDKMDLKTTLENKTRNVILPLYIYIYICPACLSLYLSGTHSLTLSLCLCLVFHLAISFALHSSLTHYVPYPFFPFFQIKHR